MTLPLKALNVLSTFKAELLSSSAPPQEENEKPKKEKKQKRVFKTVRTRAPAFQRACRSRQWWTPVY